MSEPVPAAGGAVTRGFAWVGRGSRRFGRGLARATGINALLVFVGRTVVLLLQAVAYVARGRVGLGLTIHQMSLAGVNSLPVALVTIFFSGLVFSYYVAQQAVRYSGQQYVGWVVAEAIFRELGPALTAVVVAARAGSAMTAELGSMVVTEQIDALRALAVDPVRYLVVPRLVAAALMLPVVTLFADVSGLAGGYVQAWYTHLQPGGGVEPSVYLHSIAQNIELWIPAAGLIKTFFFGIIIAIVACHYGLTCRQGAAGVGEATMQCVVVSILLVYVSNYFLTLLLYP
jgi:phospholipid/cholesterol/gamma-HCH transport system permease protein